MHNHDVSDRSLTLAFRSPLAWIVALGLLGALAVPGKAQPSGDGPLRLSVEEALSRAQEESFAARASEADERVARARRRRSLGVFLPHLTLSEQALASTDPVNAFGFRLKQERFTQQDFAIDALNEPDRVDHFATQVTVQQPILNLDGLFKRRAAADAARAADQKTEWTRAKVTFRVKKGYYGLLLAERRVAVIDSALQAARANRDQAQALYEEGIINQADRLAAEVRVSELESRRTDALAARRTAADRLRFLIGVEADVEITPTDSLIREQAALAPISVEAANQRRSDMQALRFRAEAAREKIRARWLAFMPKLNAQGTAGWYDDTPFGTRGQSWTAGVSLSWSLFEGYQQIGRAQQAEAERLRAEIAVQRKALRNEVEIRSARRDIEAARERIDQARRAVEQAEESLRIRSDRYEQGMARTTDLLQAEATLAERRLAHLKALYDHNVAVYRLEMLTEQDLTTGKQP
jgi:outer membrane protein TolC